jgi:hypothetical protein
LHILQYGPMFPLPIHPDKLGNVAFD